MQELPRRKTKKFSETGKCLKMRNFSLFSVDSLTCTADSLIYTADSLIYTADNLILTADTLILTADTLIFTADSNHAGQREQLE